MTLSVKHPVKIIRKIQKIIAVMEKIQYDNK